MTTLAPACAPSSPDPRPDRDADRDPRPGEPGYGEAAFRRAASLRLALAGPAGRYLAHRVRRPKRT